MAKAKTKIKYRTREKIKYRTRGAVQRFRSAGRRIGQKQDTVNEILADVGLGSTVSVVKHAIPNTSTLPAYTSPAVSFALRAVTVKGNMMKRLLHGAISALDAYLTDRVIENKPIIPSLGVTTGSGSGFTVVS